MKIKNFFVAFLLVLFSAFSFAPAVLAVDEEEEASRDTLLPSTEKSFDSCEQRFRDETSDDLRESLKGREDVGDILGCAIKTGNIRMFMIPYYIRYFLEFLIGIAGLLSVAAVVLGGFYYVFSGISEDKEKGKKAILNGLLGMVIVFTAWAAVNIVISLLTI